MVKKMMSTILEKLNEIKFVIKIEAHKNILKHQSIIEELKAIHIEQVYSAPEQLGQQQH